MFLLIWLAGLALILYFGMNNIPATDKAFGGTLNLANWDGGHYLGIAKFNYQYDYQRAFFPLYPLLIKTVNFVTGNYLTAAVAISLVSFFLAIQLLFRLVSLDFDKTVAEKAVWFLIIFPTSFYFLTAYSEGLFLLLAVAAFFFSRQGNLKMATLMAMLASATKLIGLAVALGLLVEVAAAGGFNRRNWFVLLAPAGFVAYCWYLFNTTGDPFYFLTAESHWQRVLALPGVGFWETLTSLARPGFIAANFNAFLDLLFAVFGLGIIIRSFRFLPVSLSVYGLVSILFPLLTPSLSSMPRFLLPIFPIFITLALFKNKYVGFLYQFVSVLLLAVFAVLFINGYWVS